MEAAATNAKAYSVRQGSGAGGFRRVSNWGSTGFMETKRVFVGDAVTPCGGAGTGAGAGAQAASQTFHSIGSGGQSPSGGDIATGVTSQRRDTSARTKRPRAEVSAMPGMTPVSQARNVLRRLAADTCVAVKDRAAPESERAGTAVAAGRTPPQVLVHRRRLRPILKSHSACAVTGRGAVSRAAVVANGSTAPAKTVPVACSTPGGNTPSPRLFADGGATRAVRFAKSVKAHDGLRVDNQVFDKLVTSFFAQDVRGCHKLLSEHAAQDPLMPRRLVLLCHDLAERIVASTTGTAAVLPQGGGSVSRLGQAHMPTLLVLQGMLTEASLAAYDDQRALSTAAHTVTRFSERAKVMAPVHETGFADTFDSDEDSFDMSDLSDDEDSGLMAFDWGHVAELASRAATPVAAR